MTAKEKKNATKQGRPVGDFALIRKIAHCRGAVKFSSSLVIY
jgi:hypothetical protein